MSGEQQTLDEAKQQLVDFIKAQVLYLSESEMKTLKALYFAIQPCRTLMGQQAANYSRAFDTFIAATEQFQQFANKFPQLDRTLKNLLAHYTQTRLGERILEGQQDRRKQKAANSARLGLGFEEFSAAAQEFEASIQASLGSFSPKEAKKLESIYLKIKQRDKVSSFSQRHSALQTLFEELKQIQENFPALKLQKLLPYYKEWNPALRHAVEQENWNAFLQKYQEYVDKKLDIEERYHLLHKVRNSVPDPANDPQFESTKKALAEAIETQVLELSERQTKALKDLYSALQPRDKLADNEATTHEYVQRGNNGMQDLEETTSAQPSRSRRFFASIKAANPQKKLNGVLELLKDCQKTCENNEDLSVGLQELRKLYQDTSPAPVVPVTAAEIHTIFAL